MYKIVVLAGGISNEREVSLRSGAAVAKALESKGHEVVVLDPAHDMDRIGTPDVVFPALHGIGGEDGTLQAQLEMRGIAYVGSGVATTALCMDKWLYRQVVQAAGLPIAEGEMVSAATIWDSPLSQKPFVLKPSQGGSTLDVHIVHDPQTADKTKIEADLRRYGMMLLEELADGIELTVGVLAGKALPAVEIIPPENGEFDYENKYNGKTLELCPPEHIDEQTHTRIKELAVQAHQLVGCRDLSRTDIIVTKDGRYVILETNTLPGMTDQSLFPKAANAGGVPFDDLVDMLVGFAVARHNR
jgi:D-alanine-D-alanine ligase